jgi:hypothetical protein
MLKKPSMEKLKKAQETLKALYDREPSDELLDIMFPKTCHELFSQGYVELNSIDEFLKSATYCYIGSIYNGLVYREEPRPNFLNVYHVDGKVLVVDNIFYDRFPDLTPVACLVPPVLDYPVEQWQKGSRTPFSAAMDKYGVFVSYQDNEFKDDHGEEFWKRGIDKRPENRKQKEGYTLDYLIARDPNDGSKFISPRINQIVLEGYCNLLEFVGNNYSLTHTTHNNSAYQQMVKGYRMDRHIDTNKGDCFVMTYISYQMDERQKIEGREIFFGRRTEEDLQRWMENHNRSDVLSDDDTSTPETFEDYLWVKPRHGLTLYVNSWNPIFYHGINQMTSDTKIYTVINNFKW